MSKHFNNKAQVLIAAILIIVLLALVSTIAVSLIGTQIGHSASGLAESTQSFYLAHAGLEWYMQQLADDTDWTDQTTPVTQNFGSGSFRIDLSNITATSMDIVSTGIVVGPDGRNRERFISTTVNQAFPGTRFAVFWQEDGPGATLTFDNGSGGTHIAGDFWCVGSASIGSNSDVTSGWVYYGQGETISGSGSYTAQVVTSPFPSMPSLDTTYYDNLITDWNSRIDAANVNNWGQNGGSNLTLSSDVDWTNQNISQRDIDTNGYDITGTNFTVSCKKFQLKDGSEIDSDASNFTIECRREFTIEDDSQINASNYTINTSDKFKMEDTASINSSNFAINAYKDFDTDGTVSITGYGYIVCSNSGKIVLHHRGGDSGTFTATPSGGNIYFLSGQSMTVNSSGNDTYVTLNSGCFLYSRDSTGTNQLLKIIDANTSIDSATIIAERRLIVEDGADITNSVLYVDYATSANNNMLQITDSDTTVSGTVVSRGREDPSLQINSAASVTGVVYQYGSSSEGSAEIDGASTITGALLVRQFDRDSFGPATVTHDLASLPSPLPNGFEDFQVYAEENDWDGL